MAIDFTSAGVSSGSNNPTAQMYAGFTGASVRSGQTLTLNSGDLAASLNLNIHDPAGNASRPLTGVQGPWANPHMANFGGQTFNEAEGTYYKYNQMMMTIAQHFDPFVQKKELASPRWWFSRIPRGAFKLFDGLVHETRIYRGGLTTYAGLSQWEDINPWPDGTHDPCAPLKYDTYNYGWESLAWRGKRAGWGSDPICLDTLKFLDRAAEQLGWILETGSNYGMDMQEVWNRDMFIYQSVQAGKSILMTSQCVDILNAPRYVYDPFVKFAAYADGSTPGTGGTDGVADTAYVDAPFIVFDAEVGLEPLNFDFLDQVREYLKTMCPEAAVAGGGGEAYFGLAVSQDEVERYIRGNEEERRYWIEDNPHALIQHSGFAPTTFRKWVITNDNNQLRFKLLRLVETYDATEAAHYGNVGYKELAGKKVWIAKFVPPRIAAPNRPGVNGSVIPVYNPEYYKAEIAIAPVFMNKVFTNLFVPAGPTTLGSGTYFGPVTGLNGKWGWRNIVSWDKNPDGKIGNFYGEFEIVPKPEPCVFECFSVLYRRCTQALPSLCPAENAKINPTAATTAKTVGDRIVDAGAATVTLGLANGLLGHVGDEATVKTKAFSSLASSGALTVTGGTDGLSYTLSWDTSATPPAWKVVSDGTSTAAETCTVKSADIVKDGSDWKVDVAFTIKNDTTSVTKEATGVSGAITWADAASATGYIIAMPATKTAVVQLGTAPAKPALVADNTDVTVG